MRIWIALVCFLCFLQNSSAKMVPPKQNKYAIGFDLVSGARQVLGLNGGLRAIPENFGLQLSRRVLLNKRIFLAFNCYNKDFSAGALPQSYFQDRAVSGYKFKLGFQYLLPVNEHNNLHLVLGLNSALSTNKLTYRSILFEPIFQTEKIINYQDKVNILSLEVQTGIELQVKRRIEISILPSMGLMNKTGSSDELLYAYPGYGFAWKHWYIGIQSYLMYRFH